MLTLCFSAHSIIVLCIYYTEFLSSLYICVNILNFSFQLILTANEFDAIAVHQSTGLPAVSLPLGSSALPLEVHNTMCSLLIEY